VIAVAEADAVGFLNQLDAVEDSAADVGGSLERVAAGSGDDERLLARLETADESLIAVVSEQTASDRGNGDVGNVEIYECVVGIACLRMGGRGGVTRAFERLVDIRNREEEPRDRSLSTFAALRWRLHRLGRRVDRS
jgi:hypothetical protein